MLDSGSSPWITGLEQIAKKETLELAKADIANARHSSLLSSFRFPTHGVFHYCSSPKVVLDCFKKHAILPPVKKKQKMNNFHTY